MKLAEVDWSVLKGSMALFALAVVAGGALVSATYYFGIDHQERYDAEQRKLQSVRLRYQTVDEEGALIERYLPGYRALERSGVIGDEQRLQWVETLRGVAARLRIPSLRYQMLAQAPLPPGGPLNLGGFKAYVTRMKLDVGLLHEEDLPRLLGVLEGSARGLFRVTGCEISPAAPEIIMEPDRINLKALCELEWLTLRRPGERRS